MAWGGGEQYDPKDFKCEVCGHTEAEHDIEHNTCRHDGCTCDGFEDKE